MLFVYHAGGGAQGRPAEIKPIIQCAEERSGSGRRGRNASGLFEEVARWLESHRLPTWRLAARATERTEPAGRGRALGEVSALSQQPGGNVAWRGRSGTREEVEVRKQKQNKQSPW